MKPKTRKKQWMLFGVVTLVCLGVGITLHSTEPVKETTPTTPPPPKRVTVQKITPDTYPVIIKGFGEASPKWETTLRAQVNGEIVYINENLQPGRRLTAGESILKMDRTFYLAELAQAKQELADAKVHLLQTERQAEQAKSDWNHSGFKGAPSSSLVFHGPQVEAAKARIASAERQVANILRSLKHTHVKAPYAGLVVERFAHKGGTLFAGDDIAGIVSLNDIEIKVNLDAKQTMAMGRWQDAVVHLTDPSTGRKWRGKIVRDGGIMDRSTRLRSFYIVSDSKSNSEDKNILPGMFLTVSIQGISWKNLLALPESSLTRDGYFWYADETRRLKHIRADVAFYQDGKIFIKNRENIQQMNVVITPVAGMFSGIQVTPVLQKEQIGAMKLEGLISAAGQKEKGES